MAVIGNYVLIITIILMISKNSCNGSLETVYMEGNCGKTIRSDIGGSIEITKKLTYHNGMDCTVTLTVAANHQILLLVRRFELEKKVRGNCVDHLTIHDGNSTSSDPLRADKLCGSPFTEGITEIVSTTNSVTFVFHSDNKATKRGFQMNYIAFDPVPCADTSDIVCKNGKCISNKLLCDGVDHCGDGTDENILSCPVTDAPASSNDHTVTIILSSIFGTIFIIILIVILYKVIIYWRWRHWLKSDLEVTIWEDTRPRYSYPFTDKYVKFDVGERGRKYSRYPGINLDNNQADDHETDPISIGYAHPNNGTISTVSHEQVIPSV